MTAIEPWSTEPGIYAAFAEESFSWHNIERPSLYSLLIEFVNETTVALDLGCGAGRVLGLLSVLGVPDTQLYAIDNDCSILTTAQKCHPCVNFIEHDLSVFPYPQIKEAPTLVTAHHVFQFLPSETLTKCLDELKNFLAPNARLLIGLPHPVRVSTMANAPYFHRRRVEVPTSWGSGTISCITRTVADYLNMIISAGYSITRVDEPEVVDEGQRHPDAVAYSVGPSRLIILATLAY